MAPTASTSTDSLALRAETRGQLVLDVLAYALLIALTVLLAVLSARQPLVTDDFGMLVEARRHPDLIGYLGHFYRNWAFSWPAFLLQRVFTVHRTLYGIANSIAFVSLAAITAWAGLGRRPKLGYPDAWLIMFLTSAYWFGLPAIAETVAWTTGSTAYLWCALVVVAFGIPYVRWVTDPQAGSGARKHLQLVLLASLGFFAGSLPLQAIAAAATLLVAVAAATVRKKVFRQVPARLLVGVVSFTIGALITITAPGNGVRAAAAGYMGLSIEPWAVKTYYLELVRTQLLELYPWLLCILAVAALGARAAVPKSPRKVPATIWLASAFGSTMPFLLIPRFGVTRTAFFPAVLLAVACLTLLRSAESAHGSHALLPRRATTLVLCGLLLVTASGVYRAQRSAGELAAEISAREKLILAARENGETDLVIPPIKTWPAYGVLYWDVSPDPGDPANIDIASWYGLKSIKTSPRE